MRQNPNESDPASDRIAKLAVDLAEVTAREWASLVVWVVFQDEWEKRL